MILNILSCLVVIGASTFSVLNKNIDAFSDVDVSITKDATSDDWASNRCFTMTVHNPYEDKSLYKSFSQEPGEEVECTVSTPIPLF